MLSFELQDALEDFLTTRNETPEFDRALSEFADRYKNTLGYVDGLAIGSDQFNQSAANIHNYLNSLSSTMFAGFSVKRLLFDIHKLEGELAELSAAITDGSSSVVESALESVEDFGHALDKFVEARTGQNAWHVIKRAASLLQMLDVLSRSLEAVSSGLEAKDLRPDEGTLSVLLHSRDDLQTVLGRLGALQAIYSELCQLFRISESDFPLRVAKIETGSLWVKVFGESRVIGLMISFLTAGAQYLYRNFTREGRVAAIPGKLESLNSLMDFRNRLEEAGLDTAGMDDELAKAGHALAREATCLLAKQASVTINGQLASVGNEELARQIQMAEWPKLPSPDQVDASQKD